MKGEKLVKTLDEYMILRTRFFDKNKISFKYSARNIYTSALEVNKLVKYIHILIKKFKGIINVGGPKISDYKKYKKFKKDLKSCDKSKIFNELNFKIATDASLNINKLKKDFMNKVPLEIIVPVFNEGEKILKLMEFFKSNIKTKFRVLFCYDLETDDIFEYKEKFKEFDFEIILIKNPSRGPCSAIKEGFKSGNSDCVIVYPADDFINFEILDIMYNII